MKKYILLFVAVVLTSMSSKAQQNVEKSAQKITKEMTEVLVLNEDQSAKVLDLNIRRITKANEIKAAHGDDKEGAKVQLKREMKPFYKELNALLGKEKMDIWRAYLKEKKEQQKKKKK